MSKGIFQIEGLAGYRIDVVGFHFEAGYTLVTSIVADSPREAEAELAELLESPDFADWTELWSAPHAAWSEQCFLGDAARAGIQLR